MCVCVRRDDDEIPHHDCHRGAKLYVCIYASIYICVYVYIYIYVYICVRLCVCVYNIYDTTPMKYPTMIFTEVRRERGIFVYTYMGAYIYIYMYL